MHEVIKKLLIKLNYEVANKEQDGVSSFVFKNESLNRYYGYTYSKEEFNEDLLYH